jgi:hypothetical protein
VIEPKQGVPYEVLSSFTNRLKAENDPSKLAIAEAPSAQFLAYWYLPLSLDQVDAYKQDPAVSQA